MTLLPPPRVPDPFNFSVPPELEGRVLDTLEEVQRLFPPDEEFGEVYLRKAFQEGLSSGIEIYSRRFDTTDGSVDVAYKCLGSCRKYIVGAPEVVDEDSISGLGGRIGTTHYCRNCGDIIHIWTLVHS